MDEGSGYEVVALGDHAFVLRFASVAHADIGSWTCSAVNSAGKASCVAKLETLPLAAPRFVKELSNSRLAQNVSNRIEVCDRAALELFFCGMILNQRCSITSN